MAVFNSALFNVAIERLNTPKTVKKNMLPHSRLPIFISNPTPFPFSLSTIRCKGALNAGILEGFRNSASVFYDVM